MKVVCTIVEGLRKLMEEADQEEEEECNSLEAPVVVFPLAEGSSWERRVCNQSERYWDEKMEDKKRGNDRETRPALPEDAAPSDMMDGMEILVVEASISGLPLEEGIWDTVWDCRKRKEFLWQLLVALWECMVSSVRERVDRLVLVVGEVVLDTVVVATVVTEEDNS